MRIAVTSQNFKSITGHAGKTRRFIVFEASAEAPAVEIERLDLPPGMSLHDFAGTEHPLFAMGLDAVITQSAGRGFIERMARHGIQVHATSAADPGEAAAAVAAGRPLPAPAPHDHGHTHTPNGRVSLDIR